MELSKKKNQNSLEISFNRKYFIVSNKKNVGL